MIDFKGDALHRLVAVAVILHDPQADFRQILENQRSGRDGLAAAVQLQLDLLDFGGGFVAGRRYDFSHGIFAGLDVPSSFFGGVPPLDRLQLAVFVGGELIDAVGNRRKLKCGGANALVGHAVPFVQERLSGSGRIGAVLDPRSGSHLDSPCRCAVFWGFAGHGEHRRQRRKASGRRGFLDIQRDAAAIVHDVGDRGGGGAVRTGGHGCQHCTGTRGVSVDRKHRASESPLIVLGDFL